MRYLAVLLLTFALSPAARAAEVSYVQNTAKRAPAVIYINGGIVPGDNARLMQDLVRAKPTGRQVMVVFNSEGGSLTEAMALGRTIRQFGVDTYYMACASECILAYLGGEQRHARDGRGEFGVGRQALTELRFSATTREGARALEDLKDYLNEMTRNHEIYDLLMNSSADQPLLLSQDEAVRLDIVTKLDR